MTFKIRTLRKNEISYNQQLVQRPFVVEANSLSGRGVTAEVIESLKGTYSKYGRVMLRGFQITSPDDFQALLEKAGIELLEEYLGGVSPRSNITKKLFTSTNAPGPFIISYHTEMCYQNNRPRLVGFYCSKPPKLYGETPIFDCNQIYNNIPVALRNKLEMKQLRYVRYFSAKKKWLNIYKTWQETFLVASKDELENKLEAMGLKFKWLENGKVKVTSLVPAIVVDPATNQKVANLTLFNKWALHSNLRRFKGRYWEPLRQIVDWYSLRQYDKPSVFFETQFGDGSLLTEEETEIIQKAAWDAATVFRWEKDDVLLLDNVRWGHGRLNVVKSRQVITALGSLYDVRDILPDSV